MRLKWLANWAFYGLIHTYQLQPTNIPPQPYGEKVDCSAAETCYLKTPMSRVSSLLQDAPSCCLRRDRCYRFRRRSPSPAACSPCQPWRRTGPPPPPPPPSPLPLWSLSPLQIPRLMRTWVPSTCCHMTPSPCSTGSVSVSLTPLALIHSEVTCFLLHIIRGFLLLQASVLYGPVWSGPYDVRLDMSRRPTSHPILF